MNPKDHIEDLITLAAKSPCSRDKRGALVVRDSEVIGRGYNAPVSGVCSDVVCEKAWPNGDMRKPEVKDGCSGYVEHAVAMAIRFAVEEAISIDSRTDRDTFDDQRAEGEYMPLAGCELIHLNTIEATGSIGLMDIEGSLSAMAWKPKPSRRRGCPSCAVLAFSFGVAAIWLLHQDGWMRYSMTEYAKLAQIV